MGLFKANAPYQSWCMILRGDEMQRFKFILAAACAFVATQAMAADPFVLMFGQKTATASETRSYFVPKHLGFFKEEGLDVTLQPTDGATQEMQLSPQDAAMPGSARRRPCCSRAAAARKSARSSIRCPSRHGDRRDG